MDSGFRQNDASEKNFKKWYTSQLSVRERPSTVIPAKAEIFYGY